MGSCCLRQNHYMTCENKERSTTVREEILRELHHNIARLAWLIQEYLLLVNISIFRMLFIDSRVYRCFILAPYSYSLTVIMEPIFRFLPSYFSIVRKAKGKISKSISLFLSHRMPKWCWVIRLQIFKSNISLEQIDVIVYFCVF